MTEKRVCRRYNVPGVTTKVIENSISGGSSLYSVPCAVNNLGKGGVQFLSEKKYRVGLLLEMEIQGPNGSPPILTQAEVCHAKTVDSQYEYGMRFAEIDVNVIRQVRHLCANMMPQAMSA